MANKNTCLVLKGNFGKTRGRVVASRTGIATAERLPAWRFEGIAVDVTTDDLTAGDFVALCEFKDGVRSLRVLAGEIPADVAEKLTNITHVGDPGYDTERGSFEDGSLLDVHGVSVVNVAS